PHELELVRGALARARRERRPTAVVVDGEPGVGKSRLIDEASRNVRADRVAVSAYEPEMRLPFSLGHDLTRALARSSHAAGQILDPILAPEPGGPRPDWTSVFEAAHRAAGVRDSLLITIDDFQWSDERSTALLHYLVRGAQADGDPLALVVGGRRSTAVSALVTSLERLLGDRLTRVTLGPLDHDSTVELARAVNPALDPRAAAAVADRSGGSPFWCERRKPRIERGSTTYALPGGSYGRRCAGWWASTGSGRSSRSSTRCRPARRTNESCKANSHPWPRSSVSRGLRWSDGSASRT